jgi:Resolvase, N terminal domain
VVCEPDYSPKLVPYAERRELLRARLGMIRQGGKSVHCRPEVFELSIEAQREASIDKAIWLGAEITREFCDPGKSAYVDLHKRLDFLDMLAELKRCNRAEATRIDYVITWNLSRWARNAEDHFRTRRMVL